MKRGPLIACVACHESHVVCGPERPCKRCISRGMGDSCKDIALKKRGRPRKDRQYSSTMPEQPQNDQHIHSPHGANNSLVLPLSPDDSIVQFTNEMNSLDGGCFETTFLDDLSAILNRPSSDPYMIEHNVQQWCQLNQLQNQPECPLMQNNSSCPLMQNNSPLMQSKCQIDSLPSTNFSSCSSSLPFLTSCPSSESPAVELQPPNCVPLNSVSSSSLVPSHVTCPLAPDSSSSSSSSSSSPPSSSSSPALLSPAPTPCMPVAEPGPYCLSGTSKFTCKYLEALFLNISQRMGYDSIPPSLSPLLAKLVEFYEPLISLYGNRLLDMCPQRLMYINQLINEMNVPIIVYGVFSVINVNSAVRELLRKTKSHLLNKYVFELIHPDDIPSFVKNSVECLVDFKEMERIRVRMLLESEQYCQCVLTETIHKNQNGVPLFSSLAIMRVDDV